MMLHIPPIPMREALHFLGWRGTPIDEQIQRQICCAMDEVRRELSAYTVVRYFSFDEDRSLQGTVFTPLGKDIQVLLKDCSGAILLAATLGAQSEKLLLRHQARSSVDAVMMDAVLSAAIEAVCDEQENMLREEYRQRGLHLTDRFSPGYGDMPLEQTREICSVLQAEKSIGLTVSHSGMMIPRKSVTAIIGVSRLPQKRRTSPCAVCSMNKTCALREIE